MASRKHILHVLMNGILVGRLEKKTNGSLAFNYDSSWLQLNGARPISLSLPLVEQSFEGENVYNFFDNLLPDSPQLRARIQARFHIPTAQPFDLLSSIGRDCVGAIQLTTEERPDFYKQVLFQPLTEQDIALILRQIQNYPLGMADQNTDFRLSLAGAQEKCAFLFWQGRWCRSLANSIRKITNIIIR